MDLCHTRPSRDTIRDLMSDSSLEAYPERSVAMVRAFSPALQRGLLICGAIAVVLAILGTPLVADRLPDAVGPPAIALIGAVIGMIVGFLSVPSGLRQAFESYSWLGRTEVDRFQQRTGGPVPTKPEDIDRWLASTPSTSATRMGRIEVLAFVGRYDEARSELDAIQPASNEELFEAASLRQYIDWLQTGEVDHSALAAAVERLPRGSKARRMGDVNVALAEARVRFMARDPAWSDALQAVRPPLGRDASMVALRDTWLKFGALAFTIALVVSIAVLLLR
jgi:hypothetical protein